MHSGAAGAVEDAVEEVGGGAYNPHVGAFDPHVHDDEEVSAACIDEISTSRLH